MTATTIVILTLTIIAIIIVVIVIVVVAAVIVIHNSIHANRPNEVTQENHMESGWLLEQLIT